MIIYFSATGNNKYVAQRIATETDDYTVSITDCIKSGEYEFTLKENEPLGFITPTYFWGLPSIVKEFIEQAVFTASGLHYVYHVLTYGTTTGAAGADMETLLKTKHLDVIGKYSVAMVDTWTPMFDLSDAEKNRKDTENAEPQIDYAIEKIKDKVTGDFIKQKSNGLISKLVKKEYEKSRFTKNLHVTERCIGCGICEQQCPTSSICIEDGKPVWIKQKCTMCLGCLHHCPEFAIQYGNKTEKHGQFVNPNVKMV